MDSQINLQFLTINGTTFDTAANKTDTIRSILREKFPLDRLLFIKDQKVLCPDLSLWSQNIQENDVIMVILRKKNPIQPKFSNISKNVQNRNVNSTGNLGRLTNVERQRLKDISFQRLEASKKASITYCLIDAKHRAGVPSLQKQPHIELDMGNNSTILTSPLPACWGS